jgi:protein TIF31
MQNNIRAHHGESVEEKENAHHDLESSIEASNVGFKEGKLDVHPPVVSEENYAVHDEQKQADVLSPEEYSDEGWQAATLRGRSAIVKKKNSRRKPALTKLSVDRFEEGHTGSAHKTGSQPQTKGVKEDTMISAPSQLSFGSFLKTNKPNGDPSNAEDKSGNAEAKPDRVAKPTGINRPISIASKFVSYKDVAVSPPGTVLKPILEQKEVKDKDNGLDSDLTLSSGEEDRKFTEEDKGQPNDERSTEVVSNPDGVNQVETTTDSSSDESPSATKKTYGSKLSASAPPFNPGSLLSMSHPYSTVAIYDASAVLQPVPSQAMEILSLAIDTRVPHGPRSTLYYRTGHAFQRKQGYTTHSQSTILRGNNSPTTMNPHATEFVPGKNLQQSDAGNRQPSDANPGTDDSVQVVTSLTADEVKGEMPAEEKTGQVEKIISGKGKENRGKDVTRNSYKTELARQILLSFIVKSVHDSLGSTRAELDRKPSGSDEANVEQSSIISNNASDGKESDKQQKATEVPKGQKDTEGFTVVSKRRRRQQPFMSPINGLYSQQSICTSVS